MMNQESIFHSNHLNLFSNLSAKQQLGTVYEIIWKNVPPLSPTNNGQLLEIESWTFIWKRVVYNYEYVTC